jgi:hypothetical protein
LKKRFEVCGTQFEIQNQSMNEEQPTGAHGGGIPPGWDFPEARAAAAEGLDLWLLDSSLKMTPWQRIEENFGLVGLADMVRAALDRGKTANT